MRVEPCTNRDELHEFLMEFGEPDLPEGTVTTSVLRNGDEIIGCVMSEQVTHVGPFYVKPEFRNGTAGGLLIRHAIQSANGSEIHVVAMNPETEKQCERMNMEKVEGSLWIREANRPSLRVKRAREI